MKSVITNTAEIKRDIWNLSQTNYELVKITEHFAQVKELMKEAGYPVELIEEFQSFFLKETEYCSDKLGKQKKALQEVFREANICPKCEGLGINCSRCRGTGEYVTNING